MNFYLSQDRPDVHTRALTFLSQINPARNWVVSIEEKKAGSKTDQQRRYFHKLLQVFCNETGNDMEQIKMEIKYRVLPLHEVLVNGMKHLYPVSSENTTVEQYGKLIDSIQLMCQAYNIIYPDPRDLGMRF